MELGRASASQVVVLFTSASWSRVAAAMVTAVVFAVAVKVVVACQYICIIGDSAKHFSCSDR